MADGGRSIADIARRLVTLREALDMNATKFAKLIEDNDYDLSQFSQGSVEFYNVGGEGQAGLPFAIYPSMLYYHRDAFDEAGLEYPPHKYGDPYMLDGQEVEWDMDTMWELAKRLTVDVNNNDAVVQSSSAAKTTGCSRSAAGPDCAGSLMCSPPWAGLSRHGDPVRSRPEGRP